MGLATDQTLSDKIEQLVDSAVHVTDIIWKIDFIGWNM